MNRLALFATLALAPACAAQVQATVPEPAVSVGVVATPPSPPVVTAAATTDVDAEPIATGDPEEVVATSEPPDPVYEEQTDSPGPGYLWVGGYWGWNGSDWGWNWGRWAVAPEGQVYVEPYYERVGGTVVYVRGYWGPHDYVHRSYGGDRIRFTAAVRPANYVRGARIAVEHRAGPAPGQRPGGLYEHAVGTARAIPHQTMPTHLTASANVTASVGATPKVEPKNDTANAHVSASVQETGGGHTAPAGGSAGHGGGTQPTAMHAAPAGTPPHGAPPANNKKNDNGKKKK